MRGRVSQKRIVSLLMSVLLLRVRKSIKTPGSTSMHEVRHFTLFYKQENSRTGLPCSGTSIQALIVTGLVLLSLHTKPRVCNITQNQLLPVAILWNVRVSHGHSPYSLAKTQWLYEMRRSSLLASKKLKVQIQPSALSVVALRRCK
jgi:hypothetical protein